MNKAKAAVQEFLHKDGKHETTVHETVNPAVKHENVIRTEHQQVQTAVDREVHQDHFHTSVQPIQDREVLPESHTHNLAGVETREIKHGNDDHVRQRLEAERAQFKNERVVGETQRTEADLGVVAGEHVHHHVHETIQPVIQKEVIQPSVVHTTIPIHEIHQNEAKHHTASTLPAVSMSEFKSQGGALSGREERTDAFEGQPKAVGGTLGGAGAQGTTSLTHPEGHHHHGTHGTHGTTGTTGTTGTGYNDSTTGTGSGLTGSGTTGRGGVGNSTDTTTTKKPSLLDRLNPMKDTDGDGKRGVNE